MSLVTIVNQVLSSLTIVGQVIIALLLTSLIRRSSMLDFLNRNALLFSFIVASVATLGSLFYSEIAGYEPCKLCWFQRIFMYPQMVLLGMALWKEDWGIADYSIALSSIGALIAGYHYLLQTGLASSLLCSAVGDSAACSQRFVYQFGYVTIPLMALTAFILILLMLTKKKG